MGIGENNSAVVFFLFAVILFAGNIILAVK